MAKALVILLLLPLVAAAPHSNYQDAEIEDDTIREAAETLLLVSEQGLQELIKSKVLPASTAAAEIQEQGQALGTAGSVYYKDAFYPELLERIGPSCLDAGNAVSTVIFGGLILDYQLGKPSYLAATKSQVLDAIDAGLTALDALESEDLPVQPVRELLLELQVHYEAYVVPSEPDALLDQETVRILFASNDPVHQPIQLKQVAKGKALPPPPAPDFDAWPTVDISLQPEDPMFGERMSVGFWAPTLGKTDFQVRVFNATYNLTFDVRGIANWEGTVPWNTTEGWHQLVTTWNEDQEVLPFKVRKVDTRFHGGIISPPEIRMLLWDAYDEPVFPSVVHWETVNATGSVNVTESGRLRFDVPLEEGRMWYEGNRTHAAVEINWEYKEAAIAIEGGPTDLAFADILFNFGDETITIQQELPDFTNLLRLLGIALLFFLLLEPVLMLRNRTPNVQELLFEAEAPSPELLKATPKHLHPLLWALTANGFKPDPLTLREAEPIWKELGAPDLQPWMSHHEWNTYHMEQVPPLPPALARWARQKGKR